MLKTMKIEKISKELNFTFYEIGADDLAEVIRLLMCNLMDEKDQTENTSVKAMLRKEVYDFARDLFFDNIELEKFGIIGKRRADFLRQYNPASEMVLYLAAFGHYLGESLAAGGILDGSDPQPAVRTAKGHLKN